MKKIFRRLLQGIGRLLSAFFNINIPLKIVLALLILLTAGTYFMTSSKLVKAVGGENEYKEAMRYIEIKDIVDEKFIDQVDRKAMGDSASAAATNTYASFRGTNQLLLSR